MRRGCREDDFIVANVCALTNDQLKIGSRLRMSKKVDYFCQRGGFAGGVGWHIVDGVL